MRVHFLALLSLLCLVLPVLGHPDDQIISIESVNLRLSNEKTRTASEARFFMNGENYVLGHVFRDSPLAGYESKKGIRSLYVTRAELFDMAGHKLDCTMFAENKASNPLVRLTSETPILGLTMQGKPADVGDLIFHCKRT